MKNNTTLDPLAEDLLSLRQGFNDLRQRQEAFVPVIEALVRDVLITPEQNIEWAKKLDFQASQLELFEENHAGVAWLRALRDDLVCTHGLMPLLIEAFDQGKIGTSRKPPSLSVLRNERLDRVDSTSTPADSSAAQEPEPH